MTYEEFSREMSEYRLHLVNEATMAKEMNDVWINLDKLYVRFDENEKKMAARVLGEWLQSEDIGERSDAEYLIVSFKIPVAKEALEMLAGRLTTIVTTSPMIRHELEKIQGILAKIGDWG
jgi:hypothetical protein